jgi:DNA-directed DNA polymerase III PolC
MRNFISPNSHPSSFLTGSTVEAMVDKFKELDTGYYVCTDNGYLTNALKAYNLAKKKGLKPILGCEIYVKDDSLSSKIKYYTITLHARNQEQYQYLVKQLSDKNRPTIEIVEQEYPLFNMQDLKLFAEKGLIAVVGGPQCIVSKNLLIGEHELALNIFKTLKANFADNFYGSIIPMKFDRKWVTSSIFTFVDGETATLDSTILAETDYAKTFRVPLKEVAEKHGKHKSIKKIYVNGIGYKVNRDIASACNHKNFKPMGTDIYETYNKFMKAFCERYKVPMLINDYSYLAKEDDKLVQDLKLGEETRLSVNHHICSINDVLPTLSSICDTSEIEKMVQNSYDFASKFDGFELKYDYQLVKEHDDHLKATLELIKEVGRFDETNPTHRERLQHEIKVIHGNGEIDLLPYFFPISRVLKHYTDMGRVVGPARGSAGGSFLMYCMGITQIDPIKYGLYFSRFLTLGRILKGTLPDVDVDLPDRELLLGPDGLFEKFYSGRYAQISTRTIMKLKSSIRDVNRFKFGKVEEEIERFAKNLEATPQGVSDADFVFGYEDNEGNHVSGLFDRDERLRAYAEQRPEEWEVVKRTLGISRQNGRHACAFVISDGPVTDVIPTMKVAGHENITQYEAKEVEAAGLNKYDFLIVKCLNDIELAIKYINEEHFHNKGNIGGFESGHFFHKGDNVYIWDLPEEPEVFNMLGEGKTETVFQLNTTSVTPYVIDMKPRSVEDCAVVTSLVRPGPLEFIDERTGRNMAQEYVERRHGRSKGEIPILDELLPETYGVMVFQEQITKMTKELTGWDDEKAEDVRIAVGKKKLRMIEELKPQFIEASAATGRVDAHTAATIWAMIEKFGRYGFNKSHAVAYAMIAYACAYLKHHYPLEWWAAVLSNAEEKEITEVLWPHVRDILSPPDINLSREEMVIDYESGTIRNKLSVLRGLGEKVANKITENRPYSDIQEFVEKKVIGPALTRKLIHIGVLDSLFKPGMNLMEKMQAYEDAVEIFKYKEKIFQKSENEIVWNQPLDKFIEVAKTHPKTRRCKHEIKQGIIDMKYAFMNPIKDFILKKSVFPTMPMNLHDIIKTSAKNVKIIDTGSSVYAMDEDRKEIRMINGKTYQKIKDLPVEQDSKQIINFCLAGYVVESKEFSYGPNREKKALKMNVDVDGYLEEFVIWPDYDTGILEYPEELKKNSVIFLFMYRKMGRERYHTNISSVIVEDVPVE